MAVRGDGVVRMAVQATASTGARRPRGAGATESRPSAPGSATGPNATAATPGTLSGIGRSDEPARIPAILRERGDLSLTELHQALYHNVAQHQLRAAIARLRDRGEVTLRQERRARTGRARVVVGLVGKG